MSEPAQEMQAAVMIVTYPTVIVGECFIKEAGIWVEFAGYGIDRYFYMREQIKLFEDLQRSSVRRAGLVT